MLASLLLLAAQGDLVDVALDPGHSRADVGASATGLREYRLTLDLAQRARARLEAAGRSVRLTREDDQPLTLLASPGATESIRLEQEARIAAAMPARIYVSLHFNGGPPALRGTETYFNPDRGTDDRVLAEALQRNVIAALALASGYQPVDRGVRSDLLAGKPYGHFFSLRGPVPSALIEHLFLSNPTEATLLREEATLEALADGCAQGILEYLAGLGEGVPSSP
ncbi:MAG: N-acetylmuramoyl-L-alanine amidase [Chloroflexota bacterium]|nr:N-acetylmuramoyl-L-alanine amidase [Chloroflexota bacterium]